MRLRPGLAMTGTSRSGLQSNRSSLHFQRRAIIRPDGLSPTQRQRAGPPIQGGMPHVSTSSGIGAILDLLTEAYLLLKAAAMMMARPIREHAFRPSIRWAR